MQFIDSAPLYRIVRITGPTHNMLGIQLTDAPLTTVPCIEALDGDVCEGMLAPEVLEQVLSGVSAVSRELSRKYHIEKIQYVTTDSPPVSVYRELAIELMRRIDKTRSA